MTSVPDEHRRQAPRVVRCVVITVSDTRTLETDTGGQTIVDLLVAGGHQVVERHILRDEPDPMRKLLIDLSQKPGVNAIFDDRRHGVGRPGSDL